jgi:hypothetical protein
VAATLTMLAAGLACFVVLDQLVRGLWAAP